MELSSWIQPGVIIAIIVFVWRDLSTRIDKVNQRIDRHLEGHP